MFWINFPVVVTIEKSFRKKKFSIAHPNFFFTYVKPPKTTYKTWHVSIGIYGIYFYFYVPNAFEYEYYKLQMTIV